MLFQENTVRPRMQKTVEILGEELKKISTGRLDINSLQTIEVEAYGAVSSLQSVAKVSMDSGNALTALVEVYDPSVIKNVEKALQLAEIGASVVIQGKNQIRLNFNPLTAEDRANKLPKVKKTVEEARIKIRQIRQEVKKLVDDMEGVSEDEQKMSLDQLQKLTDEYIGKIDQIGTAKEAELMKV